MVITYHFLHARLSQTGRFPYLMAPICHHFKCVAANRKFPPSLPLLPFFL